MILNVVLKMILRSLVAEQGVFPCFSSQSGIGIGLHQPADDILRARAWVGRT